MMGKFLSVLLTMFISLFFFTSALASEYNKFAVKDFQKKEDLVKFLNEKDLEIIEIETIVGRYGTIDRLWYKFKYDQYPDDPDYPDYPKK